MPELEPTRPSDVGTISQFFSEGHKTSLQSLLGIPRGGEQERDMLGITISVLTPFIRQWTTSNQHISPKVLTTFLSHVLVDFGTSFLAKPVRVPTFEDIIRKGGTKVGWHAFLLRPENLFTTASLTIS
jgi:hypothetical protein